VDVRLGDTGRRRSSRAGRVAVVHGREVREGQRERERSGAAGRELEAVQPVDQVDVLLRPVGRREDPSAPEGNRGIHAAGGHAAGRGHRRRHRRDGHEPTDGRRRRRERDRFRVVRYRSVGPGLEERRRRRRPERRDQRRRHNPQDIGRPEETVRESQGGDFGSKKLVRIVERGQHGVRGGRITISSSRRFSKLSKKKKTRRTRSPKTKNTSYS